MRDFASPPTQFEVDGYDPARLMLIALALLALVLMVILNWNNVRFSRFTIGQALVRLGVVGLLLSVAYSTAEVLLDWHTQIRIPVLTASLAWMVVGLIWSIHDERRKRNNAKS